MSLFGGDLVTVTTPDGRQLQVPSDLAAQFPGLQPPLAPEPMPTVAPDAPDAGPVTQPLAAPPPAPELPPPATGGPITSPAQVPIGDGPRAPNGPIVSPTEAINAGPSNGPRAPGPLTNDQLAKMGNAGVYNQAQGGLEDERSAIKREGAAMADQATQVGNKMAAVEAEASRQLEERRAAAEANAKAIQAKTDDYMRRAQEIADTKIDRSVDHPVLAAIGMLLTTMGAAKAGKDPSIAVNSFYQAIDRKVAAQMQDLDQKRKGLDVAKEGIGLQRQVNMDRLAEMDTYRMGYLEQAKRQIETIKQQTQSPIILAQTDKASAMITQKQNEILGTAVQREQQKREQEAARAQAMAMHRESVALTRRGQDMEQKRFDVQLEERKNEKIDALAEKMLERGDKASAEKAKKVAELGVMDPSTGDPMLSPAGLQKFAQADNFEAAARKVTDPAQAKKLAEQAQMLRESAMVNDAAVASNKKGQEEAQKVVKQTQDIANNIDAARRMLAGGPSAFDRKAWADIVVGLQGVKINYAQLMGERMSPKALDAIDDVLSIDPDSMTSRTFSTGKALEALDTMDKQVTQSADVALRSAGIKSGWTPRKATDAAKFEGQTAEEVGRGAERGSLRKSIVPGLDDERVGEATADANLRTNAKGKASLYGLEPKDDDKIRELIKRSGNVGNAAYGDIVGQLASPLIAQAEKRPTLVRGIVNLLKDEDPKLFGDVMARVQSGGGQVAAEQVAGMIQKPVNAAPISFGGPTPGAQQQIEEDRVRAKFGVPRPQQLPPMTPVGNQSAPQLPTFFASLPPAEQQKYIQFLRANGVNMGGAQ